MKKYYFASMFLFLGFGSFAHSTTASPNKNTFIVADSATAKTAEQKAMDHATYLEKKLTLNATQKKQVYAATLERVKGKAALKSKYKGDMSKAQPELNQLKATNDASIKKVLTADQLKKWELLQEDKKIKSEEPAKINQYDPTILDSQW
ncbi:hypothetical protein [uncultured Cytophaga sp.]|mgnify:CR=1 FL=1|uniref:hypothetical protein n=1 Tax=uncultured Cytophaga sp. TaxID=160238 RepID=UPI002615FA68|nr:hypothetical protein [uncultured Cytophaga sp.]